MTQSVPRREQHPSTSTLSAASQHRHGSATCRRALTPRDGTVPTSRRHRSGSDPVRGAGAQRRPPGDRVGLGLWRILDEAKAVLELRDPELELLEVGARDQAELLEEPSRPAPARSLGPNGFAAPAARRLLDQLTRLVAAHAACLGELVREGVRALGRQRNRADGCEPEPLEKLEGGASLSAAMRLGAAPLPPALALRLRRRAGRSRLGDERVGEARCGLLRRPPARRPRARVVPVSTAGPPIGASVAAGAPGFLRPAPGPRPAQRRPGRSCARTPARAPSGSSAAAPR